VPPMAGAGVFEQVFTRHHTVEALGVSTHIAEAGAGPPIVFLHGNPDTHTVWSLVIERLADRFRCIAPDMPGFGASHAPADFDCSLANQARWVRAMLDALELSRVHLVVHDVGGVYGLAFAAESPERVAALTISNTIFFPDYRWHFWARVWRRRVLGELSMKILNRPLFIRELERGSPKMTRDYASHAYDRLTPESQRMVLHWYRSMAPEVWRGWDDKLRSATAQTPKQVIWGDRDPFIQATYADRFGGAVHHIAELGHWAMIEDPERFASLVGGLVGAQKRA
jgi:pimeloyl-ACP methyl ester carboxylesterase